jgi:hypothetical protein
MRVAPIISLTIGTVLSLAVPAVAQFSLSRDGSRAVVTSQVVQREDVQKELQLTAAQIKKLKELGDETRKEMVDEFSKLADLDPKARDDKRRELVRQMARKENAALPEILNPKQMKRLKELTYQLSYVQAFRNEEVEAALSLTAEQKEKIQTAMKAAITEMRQLFQDTRDGVGEGQAQAAKIRERTYEKCVAELSADQKKQWEALQGQPFQFAVVERARPSLRLTRDDAEVEPAKPAQDFKDLRWVTETADGWLPARSERKMDLIGWADGIIPALRLARQHQRPVFLFTLDGRLSQGRC